MFAVPFDECVPSVMICISSGVDVLVASSVPRRVV